MQSYYCIILRMQDEQVDLAFEALARPERRWILVSLQARPEQSLVEICVAATGACGRQTELQHLEMPERARLVVVVWKGWSKAHSVGLGPPQDAVGLAG
jgi:hypothetical protein